MRALRLGLLALWAVAGAGCATDPASRLRSAEKENRRLTEELAETERALQSITGYTEELRSPGKTGRSFTMYYTPASLEQMASQLHADADGRPQLPQAAPGRRHHRAHLRRALRAQATRSPAGPRCGVTTSATPADVPKAYRDEVRKFQSGVASGVVADLVVELSMNAENVLLARAKATRTRLKANSNGQAEGMLRDAMNDRVLRLPFVFDLTIQGGNAVPRRMVLTANHLSVMYAP